MALVLGQRIKEEREKRNLTQEQLAQTLNASRQSISKWEIGTANLYNKSPIEEIKKLSHK